ncbi:DnaJ-domain-containing protein, partial [Marasmius fiardii PR-910]
MDHDDPIAQFFPGEESVDLYAVLGLESTSTTDDIKKAYRRLALKYHPDKQHITASDAAKADASIKFQQVGFAYTVLQDRKRRDRYDKTGKTDEGLGFDPGEDGWETYFEDLFDRVTRGKLDEMKAEYQGSTEEVEDLKSAYSDTNGSIGEIMAMIPHSTHEDEPRFIMILSDLIKEGEIPSLSEWEKGAKDEKAKLVRKKQGEKEAKEAEQLAKDLGVWDEFYGSGKTGERRSKGKGKDKGAEEEDDEDDDHPALKALIMKKQENMDSFFDGLAAKYAEPKGKGKKRGKVEEGEEMSPKKRSRGVAPPPPDIDDEEFEKLQQKLFGEKKESTGGKKKRARKAK